MVVKLIDNDVINFKNVIKIIKDDLKEKNPNCNIFLQKSYGDRLGAKVVVYPLQIFNLKKEFLVLVKIKKFEDGKCVLEDKISYGFVPVLNREISFKNFFNGVSEETISEFEKNNSEYIDDIFDREKQ